MFCLSLVSGAGEMTQLLGALAALALLRPGLGSQHARGSSQLSVNPDPEDLPSSAGLFRHCTLTVRRHTRIILAIYVCFRVTLFC